MSALKIKLTTFIAFTNKYGKKAVNNWGKLNCTQKGESQLEYSVEYLNKMLFMECHWHIYNLIDSVDSQISILDFRFPVHCGCTGNRRKIIEEVLYIND